LKNAGIVVDNPATLVSMGDITSLPSVLAAIGFFLTIALVHRGVKGAVMIAILGVTALGLLFGDVQWNGVMSTPPSI
ncbi:NCS2 family permease, partial [Escherichia coli]|nr:NCS2 family permease [Escherichia coli]